MKATLVAKTASTVISSNVLHSASECLPDGAGRQVFQAQAFQYMYCGYNSFKWIQFVQDVNLRTLQVAFGVVVEGTPVGLNNHPFIYHDLLQPCHQRQSPPPDQ